MLLYDNIIVNHRTYLRGLTSKGTRACAKRLPEKAEVEIKILMDRLTNLNSKVGSEIPRPLKDVWGVEHYVVCSSLSQSKQPTGSTSKNDENPKSIKILKRSEFGISRSTKVLGRRRIHSTTVICRKGSSGSKIDEWEFEGSYIKDQFEELYKTLKLNNKASNLTTILSDENYLKGCYLHIKSRPGNMTPGLDKQTFDGINEKWFEETCQKFRNGLFQFKPSRRVYIPKPNGKFRPLRIPSPRDKIVQEGMRRLLDVIFEKDFRNSSHAFRVKRGCHTALQEIRLKFGKVNWFLEGDIEQQYPSIDHNILVTRLREKIDDEPFIDLIYKYLKAGFSDKLTDEVNPMRIGVAQGGLISPILSNIYMHPFDEWMEDILIPKYTFGKRKKVNPEYNRMLYIHGASVDKTIRTTIASDPNFSRIYYVRYVDDFLIGIQGSKSTCEQIRSEAKLFLKNELSLTLNVDKSKITHSTTDHAVFLGYNISCTPMKKMQIGYNAKNKLVRNTTRTVLNAPIPRVLKRLKEKGFLNSKNMPTRNGRYINIDLWNIIDNHKSIERGILNYYSMANNYGRLAARVHFSLKYSCALTISSKMKLKTMRGAFRKYGKDLTITTGSNSISYPKISYRRRYKPIKRAEPNFDKILNSLIYRFKRSRGDLMGPCILCGCETDIEVHHVKKLPDVAKKKDWLYILPSENP